MSCNAASRSRTGIFSSCAGANWKTIPKDSGNRRRIRSGSGYCITSTTRFPPSSITNKHGEQMNYGRSILVAVLAAAAGAAPAGGVGIRAGTTGVGADLGWDIAPTLGGRVGISAMSVNTDVETSSVNYDAKVKLANLNLFLDWSPLGPFRITGGFIANDNKVDLTGRPTSGVAAGTTLTGQVTPERSFAPYLGVGYGNVWT